MARRHPARRSRIVTAGLSGATALLIVGALQADPAVASATPDARFVAANHAVEVQTHVSGQAAFDRRGPTSHAAAPQTTRAPHATTSAS